MFEKVTVVPGQLMLSVVGTVACREMLELVELAAYAAKLDRNRKAEIETQQRVQFFTCAPSRARVVRDGCVCSCACVPQGQLPGQVCGWMPVVAVRQGQSSSRIPEEPLNAETIQQHHAIRVQYLDCVWHMNPTNVIFPLCPREGGGLRSTNAVKCGWGPQECGASAVAGSEKSCDERVPR